MYEDVRKTVLYSDKRVETVPLSEPSKGVSVHAVVSFAFNALCTRVMLFELQTQARLSKVVQIITLSKHPSPLFCHEAQLNSWIICYPRPLITSSLVYNLNTIIILH